MKTTYIYRIDLGHNGKTEHTYFCYARNAKAAKTYYKEKYHNEKFDMFKATMFGDADTVKHPGPFEELPEDEVKYILSKSIGMAEAYSNRQDNRNIPISGNGEFIPVNEES